MIKKISAFLYKFFKRIYMVPKRLSSGWGGNILCVWLFAYKLFFYCNIAFGFKGFGVAGKVTVCNTQEFFKRIKVGVLIYHKYAHNSQPYTVVKCLVNML